MRLINHRPMLLLIASAVVLVSADAEILAQNISPADSVQHRNDCRLAEQVLLHGRPANKREWALSLFTTCPSGSRIAVELLSRFGTESPERSEEFINSVSGLVDRAIARAALDLAASSTASATRRVQALRVLYAQAAPGYPVSYAALTAGARMVDSSASSTTFATAPPDEFVIDIPVVVRTQLTPGDLDDIDVRLTRLAAENGVPQPVRVAAARVAQAFRAHRCCPMGMPFRECLTRLRARYP